jgi:hypothetical protein
MSNLFKKGKSLIDTDIVKVEISFINFEETEDTGILEVHKDVKDEVVKIFNDIKEINFPIFKIETIDKYDFDDEKSVVANNSSAYNFRFVNGTTKLSDHAIGLAIDINPKQNPWVHPYALNKFPYIPGEKGTIEKGDEVVDIFEKYGWSWGGNWRNPDYQHFFKRDVNKRVKNKLYDDLGIDNPYLQNQPKGRIDRFKKFVKKLYESNEVDKPALK